MSRECTSIRSVCVPVTNPYVPGLEAISALNFSRRDTGESSWIGGESGLNGIGNSRPDLTQNKAGKPTAALLTAALKGCGDAVDFVCRGLGVGDKTDFDGLGTSRGNRAQREVGVLGKSTGASKEAVLCSATGKDINFKSSTSVSSSTATEELLEIARFLFNFMRDITGHREEGIGGEQTTEPPFCKVEKVTILVLSFDGMAGCLAGLLLGTLTTS